MSRHSVLIATSGRSVKEFHIFSGALQARILEVLRCIDRSGVTSLGECRDGEYYILVECGHPIDLMHSQRVIKAMGVVFSEVFAAARQVDVTSGAGSLARMFEPSSGEQTPADMSS